MAADIGRQVKKPLHCRNHFSKSSLELNQFRLEGLTLPCRIRGPEEIRLFESNQRPWRGLSGFRSLSVKDW